MRLNLLLTCLLLPCRVLSADPWLTIDSVDFAIGPPPADQVRGFGRDMLCVTVQATDTSPADTLELDHENTMLLVGPDALLTAAIPTSIRFDNRPDGARKLSADLWFDLPGDQEALRAAELRLSLRRYTVETVNFSFEAEDGEWRFPLEARNSWLDAVVIGIGLGEVEDGTASVTRWLAGGAPLPERVTEGITVEEPRLLAVVAGEYLVSDGHPVEVALLTEFGDFVPRPLHIRYGGPLRQGIAFQRTSFDCIFSNYAGPDLRSFDHTQLPDVTRVTLSVTRRVPLGEAWAPLSGDPRQ